MKYLSFNVTSSFIILNEIDYFFFKKICLNKMYQLHVHVLTCIDHNI